MKYLNRNYHKNTFRYKKIDNNTNLVVEIIHSNSIIKYNTTQTTNGKSYHFEPYNYKPQWLFRFFWRLKSIKYQKPKAKLNPQSKRHITVVVFMILTIVAMFYIAYRQGAFD